MTEIWPIMLENEVFSKIFCRAHIDKKSQKFHGNLTIYCQIQRNFLDFLKKTVHLPLKVEKTVFLENKWISKKLKDFTANSIKIHQKIYFQQIFMGFLQMGCQKMISWPENRISDGKIDPSLFSEMKHPSKR